MICIAWSRSSMSTSHNTYYNISFSKRKKKVFFFSNQQHQRRTLLNLAQKLQQMMRMIVWQASTTQKRGKLREKNQKDFANRLITWGFANDGGQTGSLDLRKQIKIKNEITIRSTQIIFNRYSLLLWFLWFRFRCIGIVRWRH